MFGAITFCNMYLHMSSTVLFGGGSSPCTETTTPTSTRVELDEFDGDEMELDEFVKEVQFDEVFMDGAKTVEI
jgi:hypothetical protein